MKSKNKDLPRSFRKKYPYKKSVHRIAHITSSNMGYSVIYYDEVLLISRQIDTTNPIAGDVDITVSVIYLTFSFQFSVFVFQYSLVPQLLVISRGK